MFLFNFSSKKNAAQKSDGKMIKLNQCHRRSFSLFNLPSAAVRQTIFKSGRKTSAKNSFPAFPARELKNLMIEKKKNEKKLQSRYLKTREKIVKIVFLLKVVYIQREKGKSGTKTNLIRLGVVQMLWYVFDWCFCFLKFPGRFD